MLYNVSHGLALISTLVAATIFYLSCPNQQWLKRSYLPFYPALLGALLLLTMAVALLMPAFSFTAALFSVLCVAMLALGLLPFLGKLPQPAKHKPRESMLKKNSSDNFRSDWWLKTATALLLGFPLAVGLSGIFAWLAPGAITHTTKTQVVMWLITPLWLIPLALVYFFRSGLRALIPYALATGLTFAALYFIKTAG